ncbi:Re/Si-specific NAD(P)(+) transhydrogenase subunit alpha [Solirubrobacter sp. CPCC 204708]|uniref:proton-translocating NAD(P)(+) transhydrogenase n=1 Tax=Solirubrobacter deserti TaxID=2282478 RepID=A0ABT4RDM9_9ACTN|nr:Re/Si-specific NAD(P)(+) transhydrogenase subunit alpha [Solirubrobacter deserti]MBE2314636.1 Re/Si-specific NAD(P)(+) transhydrogenase subunit alpha [Solirubrobacter deserti]MDA0136643.1 Re/Si-specific NAD(P)(+) transhydrogenase subunit alpha [Solirubrobacter deserti]
MRIGVPKERVDRERRVALVPDVVRRLRAAEHEVVIEAAAGLTAGATDEAYVQAGATIGDPWGAQVVAKVAPPTADEVARLGGDTILVGFLNPLGDPGGLEAIAARGATALAMEKVPRISRAQSMDALSSQATVSGYRAVLIAATELPRFFPMFMTAAGTVPPAQVLVLGAGVAGLQAIATARRLGAVVTAFDIRSAVKEQIQSLGAKFFEVEGIGDAEAAGGYARELTPEEQQLQREALSVQMGKSDVIVTTALVPGRPAPKLIPAAAVEGMRAGSVIVDLAAEAGGNCELTQPGETFVTDNGVKIIGPLNLPSEMAEHASALYARNILSLIELGFDPGDEVVAGATVVRNGKVV